MPPEILALSSASSGAESSASTSSGAESSAAEPAPQAPAGRGWIVALGMLVMFMAIAMRIRTFWSDEGWYLLSGREVLAGRLPYRDFLYPQMPGTVYLSALVQALGVETLLHARLVWGLVGLAGLGLAADLSQRLFGGDAWSRFWWLAAMSPLVAVGYITCCSWAPGAFGAVLPFWLLARFGVHPWALFGAGMASMLAFAMKVSLAPLWVGALIAGVASGGRVGFFLLGSLVGVLPLVGLALLNLPGFIYGVFGMHSAQGETLLWLYRALKTLFGTVAGLGTMLWAVGLNLQTFEALPLTKALDRFHAGEAPELRMTRALPQAMLIGGVGTTLLHFLPMTVGELYHLHVLPLLMVLAVGRALPQRVWAGLLLTGLLAQLSLVGQMHQVEPRSSSLTLSWPDPIQEQARIRSAFRAAVPTQTPVFTFEAWLLWEEKLPLVHGVELGPYSLQRGLEPTLCEPLRTLAPSCVLERLALEKPEVVALTHFDLQYLEMQALPAQLESWGYRQVADVPEVGMMPSTLRIWRR